MDQTPREALAALSDEIGFTRLAEWFLASPWRWGPLFAVGGLFFVASFAMTLPMLF